MKDSKKTAMILLTVVSVFCLLVVIPTFIEQQKVVASTPPLYILPNNTNVGLIWDYRYRKVDVTTSEEWSNFDKVSDSITTSSTETKKVLPNIIVTHFASIIGNISNINVDIGKDISSSIGGATLGIGPNRKVHMGFRAMYNIETGTREKYDLATGRVISSNSYIVKSPSHGEYKLIDE